MKHALTLLLVAALASAAVAAPAKAPAPGTVNEKGQVILSWDQFVKITGYDPTGKGPQTLTIPWAEVQKMLGDEVKLPKTTGTVDLPWQDFKALLQWSIERKQAAPTTPPPTDFVVTASEYVATLTDEEAKFTLKLTLNVLKAKGWKRIPLLPSTVAVTKATLPAGAFLNSAGTAYELLTQGTGEMPIELAFSVAVQKSGGVNQLSFPRPLRGASVLDLTVDRKDVDVKVAGSQSLVTTAADATTKVAAAIPSGTSVSISWQRALPKVEAAPSKLYAETRTLVAVAEGILLCRETVNFNILHSPIRELKLTVPTGVSVLSVQGSNVQDWRVEAGQLAVVLRSEVIGSYTLGVAYERAAGAETEAPILRSVGVERERGYVGIVAVSNVEITGGAVAGAVPIDVRRLPSDIVAMTNQPILLGYRYLGADVKIPLNIKRHGELAMLVTIVDSGLYTAMQLNDGRRITKVLYNVRNNRNQFLRLTMPAGAEIWSVSVGGNPVSAATDEAGKVLVPLIRSQSSARELAAFPVELVYVETPAKPAEAKGTLKIALPTCASVPVMHVMVEYYAPAEGTYGRPAGLFGGGTTGFAGPLRPVKQFTELSAAPGRPVVRVDASKEAAKMQKKVAAQIDARARAAGATPIRVRLPLNGKLFKLEKILALPGDSLWFELTYSGWKIAK